VFLADADPDLDSIAHLDRRRHIEPYLTSLVDAVSAKNDELITVADRSRRVLALAGFLTDITEWGWPDAPPRKLVFRDDIPKLPQVLPRYLPVDVDRRLTQALVEHPGNQLAAAALRLQRCCGLRIGELLDLELDCVHELPGHGSWLKVPLGKLDTERMVPLDPEILALIDHIIEIRSPGRPLPHPRYRRPAQFLFTHHGRRLSQNGVRAELDRAAETAGLDHVTPHQLRHTYATALVNAGVSLQALMALLGHQSAAMSLRYGRLFDHTVRSDYERALALAKERLGPVLPEAPTEAPGGNWRELPLIKSRLAGGHCLRTPAQGACPYTNICEHCPNFRSEPSFLPILAAQRADAEALQADAERRGWGQEASRHRALIERLDALIGQAQAA
jgi:integrase